MILRQIENQLRTLSRMYPVVTITGPRQSGKTTLARAVFPAHGYVSLEDFDLRQMAQVDPKGFLRTFSPPVIFDEIQRVPSLLSYIQTLVDEERSPDQYILTGSHQPLLGESVTQSLAGRTGYCGYCRFRYRNCVPEVLTWSVITTCIRVYATPLRYVFGCKESLP